MPLKPGNKVAEAGPKTPEFLLSVSPSNAAPGAVSGGGLDADGGDVLGSITGPGGGCLFRLNGQARTVNASPGHVPPSNGPLNRSNNPLRVYACW